MNKKLIKMISIVAFGAVLASSTVVNATKVRDNVATGTPNATETPSDEEPKLLMGYTDGKHDFWRGYVNDYNNPTKFYDYWDNSKEVENPNVDELAKAVTPEGYKFVGWDTEEHERFIKMIAKYEQDGQAMAAIGTDFTISVPYTGDIRLQIVNEPFEIESLKVRITGDSCPFLFEQSYDRFQAKKDKDDLQVKLPTMPKCNAKIELTIEDKERTLTITKVVPSDSLYKNDYYHYNYTSFQGQKPYDYDTQAPYVTQGEVYYGDKFYVYNYGQLPENWYFGLNGLQHDETGDYFIINQDFIFNHCTEESANYLNDCFINHSTFIKDKVFTCTGMGFANIGFNPALLVHNLSRDGKSIMFNSDGKEGLVEDKPVVVEPATETPVVEPATETPVVQDATKTPATETPVVQDATKTPEEKPQGTGDAASILALFGTMTVAIAVMKKNKKNA